MWLSNIVDWNGLLLFLFTFYFPVFQHYISSFYYYWSDLKSSLFADFLRSCSSDQPKDTWQSEKASETEMCNSLGKDKNCGPRKTPRRKEHCRTKPSYVQNVSCYCYYCYVFLETHWWSDDKHRKVKKQTNIGCEDSTESENYFWTI